MKASMSQLANARNQDALAALRINPDWAKVPLFDRSNWQRVKFGDVVENVNETERSPAEAGIERFIGLEHLEPGSLHIRSWGNVADGTTFNRLCRPGQVLFGKRRAYQRKVAVAEFDAVVSGDIYVLAPKGKRLLPELLPFLCMSERFFQHAVGTSAGSLSPRTNWNSLASFEFGLPPLDQQRRIAEVLWAVDRSQKKYQDTVLQIDEARKRILADLIEAAGREVRQVSIAELGLTGEDVLRTGPFGTKLSSDCFANNGIPIINISAIGDATLKKEALFFLKPSLANEFRSYLIRTGDLVFSRVAEIGRCMLIDESDSGSMISSNLIRIRVDSQKILPMYLILLLRHCNDTRDQIRRLTSTGGRMLVNTRTLAELRFALPSRLRQEEVVQRSKHFEEIANDCDNATIQLGSLANEIRERLTQ